MNGWQETLLHSALCAQNENELFAVLISAACKLGFKYCAYGMHIPLPISSPKVHMQDNYSPAWQRRYVEQDYLSCDPTVAHALRSNTSLIWNEDLFASCRHFWEDARHHGLRVGWSQPCHGPNQVTGLLTLTRTHDELSEQELRETSLTMHWVAQLAHQRMSQLLLPKLLPEASITLSARETEVLRWTADGKTSYEVSEIMKISERTVNFHVNNAMEKLGTNNKTAAAVKAVVLGLL